MANNFQINFVTESKLKLTGHIDTFNIPQLFQQLNQHQSKENETLTFDMQDIKYADSNAFWAIRFWSNQHQIKPVFINLEANIDKIAQRLPIASTALSPNTSNTTIFSQIKQKFTLIMQGIKVFIDAFLTQNPKNKQQKRLMRRNFAANVYEFGFKAIPVFCLITFFLGLVIMFEGTYHMSQFAAEWYAVDFLTLSVFRELGPILSAVIIASRSGSAITAQIGTMKNNEEIAMLNILGLSPIKLIVLPKILALTFVGGFLTLLSCTMALFGGVLVFITYLKQSAQLFFNIAHFCLTPQTFWLFAWKGPLFAFLIGLIACTQGLSVKNSSVGISKKTTASVVASLITILIVDGIISLFLSANTY